MRLGCLNLLIRHVLVIVAPQRTLVSMRSHIYKGHQSLGNSSSQRSATPRGGGHEPMKGNGYDVQRPRIECSKCGLTHSREYR